MSWRTNFRSVVMSVKEELQAGVMSVMEEQQSSWYEGEGKTEEPLL